MQLLNLVIKLEWLEKNPFRIFPNEQSRALNRIPLRHPAKKIKQQRLKRIKEGLQI